MPGAPLSRTALVLFVVCGMHAARTSPAQAIRPAPRRGYDAIADKQAGRPGARRAGALPSEAGRLGRAAEIVGTNEISRSRCGSIPDLLEEATSVQVSERVAGSVRADVSIRGSTFEQVLLTLDGVPLADPRAARHNTDFPFPPGALGRIAVIPGPGSAVFGPGAFAGVIDLAPRRPASSGIALETACGSFGTLRGQIAADLARPNVAVTADAAGERSDGFRPGADYRTWSAWGSLFARTEGGGLRVSAGHGEKDAGARGFYAHEPGLSRARTRVTLVDLAPRVEPAPGWVVEGLFRHRHHADDLLLIAGDFSSGTERHVTDTFIERAVLRSSGRSPGTTALGVERTDALLASSTLGGRSAAVSAAFVEQRLSGEDFTADLGLRVSDYSAWGTRTTPSVSLAVPLSDALTWRACVARGVRPPGFDELYAANSARAGNPDLRPEEAWGGESGFDVHMPGGAEASAAYFVREAENLIDWIRVADDGVWRAANTGDARIEGFEGRFSGRTRFLAWETAYRHTAVEAFAARPESAHAAGAARHDARLALGLPETHGFSASFTARYRDLPALNEYWLLSARLAQRLGKFTMFVRGRNLLDAQYEEIADVAAPGRYLETGVALDL